PRPLDGLNAFDGGDRAGDDQIAAVQAATRCAYHVDRIGVGGTICEKIRTGASCLTEGAALVFHLRRRTGQFRGMAMRPAGKRKISRIGAFEDANHVIDVSAAEKPIYTKLATEFGGLQARLFR